MKERTTEKEKIYSADGAVLAEVVIAASSVRKFALMGDDYVRLDFSLTTAQNFPVGSYIDDEIFGRFVITTAQMPKYVKATASYSYELQFNAPHIAWGNFVHMLTAEVDGVRVRKEAEWTLTQTLAVHAQEIVNNIAVIFGETYTVAVSTTATKRLEAKTVSYDGVSILDALNSLADEYGTEWYVDDTAKTIYFGKVESTGDALELSLNTNVQEMDIDRDRDTYANKLYVYGGTENLPYTYRRKLVLAGIQLHTVDDATYYTGDHALTPSMFLHMDSAQFTRVPNIEYDGRGWTPNTGTQTVTLDGAGNYALSTTTNRLAFPALWLTEAYTGTITATVAVYIGSTKICEYTHDYEFSGTSFLDGGNSVEIEISGSYNYSAGTNRILTQISWSGVSSVTCSHYGSVAFYNSTTGAYSSVTLDPTTANVSEPVQAVTDTGESCYIMFNPLGVARYDDDATANPEWYYFAFCTAAGVVTSAPDGFGEGSTLTLNDDGFVNIPTAFYSLPIDDPNSLVSIGATRLKLPEDDYPGGYILDGDPSAAETIEGVVAFEDIYPDGKLKVSAIAETERKDHTEYDGESEVNDWTWTQYALSVKLQNGNAFPFKLDYQLAGTLKVRFLTPDDVDDTDPGDGYKLAGMTFEVEYNRYKDTYTIVRNTDYGAQLPNGTLYPQVGDACVLVGYNPKAFKSLGLIADAEERLAAKAQEYVEALNQAQFTFNCTMTSAFLFGLNGSALRLNEAGGSAMDDADEKALYVPNGFSRYDIPAAGLKVTIVHDALKSPVTSRVIGCEYKLDKPYDAPKLTVGETQAYSRLAQIEKEINIIK